MAVPTILFKYDGDDDYYRNQCRNITSIEYLTAINESCARHIEKLAKFDEGDLISDPNKGYKDQSARKVAKSYKTLSQQIKYRMDNLRLKALSKEGKRQLEGKQTEKTAESSSPDNFQKPKRVCWAETPENNMEPVTCENRFESLETEVADMEVTSEKNDRETGRKRRPPPITFESDDDPNRIVKILTDLNGSELEVKCNGNNFTIKPKNLEAYDAIRERLLTENIAFFTRTPKERKPLKFVIKGFPLDKDKELQVILKDLGYTTLSITSLYRKKEGSLPPPYVITLDNKDENREMEKIKKLSFYKVKVQKLRRQRGRVLICYNCQLTGHSSHSCFRKQACLNCGEEHRVKDCPRQKEAPSTCARCKGAHRATSLDCPQLQRKTKSNNKKAAATFPARETTSSVPEAKKQVPELQTPGRKRSYADVTSNKTATHTGSSSFPLLTGNYKPDRVSNFLAAYDKLKTAKADDDICMFRMDAMAAFLRLTLP